LTLKTDCRALIPRPETEWLVEQLLACPEVWAVPEPRLVDVGTGTGCIALALAAARPSARLLALDLDVNALALARENRDRLGLAERVELRQGDLLSGLPPGVFDAVVSNPPYIPTAVCGTLDRNVRDYEPRQALDGGPDGLTVIRRLAPQAMLCLKPGRPLWLEIGFDQGPEVVSILGESGFERVEIRRDAAGHARLVCGWRRDTRVAI
jgi:release factor glutamine methyltransferase